MPPERRGRVALVAPRDGPPGGQSVQAAALEGGLRAEGWDVVFVPTDPRFPPGLRGVRRVPYARTVLNEALYLARLRAALRGCRAALVFAAAYWSFVISPLPAIVAARRRGARTIVVYHSGWDRLRGVFARHGDYVRQEVLADELREEASPSEAASEQQKIDGHEVTLGVRRA